MLLSLEWLRALVDLDHLEPEEISQRLTIATAEVDGLREIELSFGGRVAEVVDNDGAPMLSDGRELLPGAAPADLAPGTRVVVDSSGALAKPPGGGQEPWLIEGRLIPGTPVSDLVSATDVLLELDNKSLTHRPDLWGHYGFARELSAIFSRELAQLPAADLSAYDGLPAVPVSIESADCSYYSAIGLRCAASAPSTLTIQRRLAALGQRSLGLAIDLSNYVMFELAQPTHAFDARGVNGLRVAPAGAQIEMSTIDGETRKLLPEDLLIWTSEHPVGLAGIVGSLESGIAKDSSRLILESANFSASRVRRTQLRLGFRTEAGQRFEKSQPLRMASVAAARFVQLVSELDANADVETRFSCTGQVNPQLHEIEVSAQYFSHATGAEIPTERSTGVLRSLGFKVAERDGDLTVTVPPFRGERDISGSHDLLEEVARIVGYDNIEPKLPMASCHPAPLAESLRQEYGVRNALAIGHRFNEVQTYGWFDEQLLDRIGHRADNALVLANPTAPQLSYMRTSLIPNLLAVARLNRERPIEGRIFEIGHVYERGGAPAEVRERKVVGAAIWDRARATDEEQLVRRCRGAVEDILAVLRVDSSTAWCISPQAPTWLESGGALDVTVGEEVLGSVGLVPATVADVVGRRLRVAIFELDLDAIGRVSPAPLRFQLPTVYPGSWFDLSLELPAPHSYEALATALYVADPLLVRRDFIGVFHDQAGVSSYTFRFWVEAGDRTLSAEEVDTVRSRLLDAAARAGAKLRSRA